MLQLDQLVKDYKLQLVWRDPIAKKILIDVFTNSQFRRCKYLKKQFIDKLHESITKCSTECPSPTKCPTECPSTNPAKCPTECPSPSTCPLECPPGFPSKVTSKPSLVTDDEVYAKMWNYVHVTMPKSSKKLLNLNNHYFRSVNRAEKIQFLIRKYLKTENANVNMTKRQSISILDIGCAEGNITIRVGDYLDLEPSQINGCDVTDLADNHENTDKFMFKHLKQCSDTRLPYEDNSQDVVLALMSLHHIRNIDLMMREINRVLKVGGLLIIREHDSTSQKFATILDVIHGFYGMVWSNPAEFTSFSQYYAKYFGKEEMTRFIENCGFKEIYNDCRNEPYPQFHKNKIINPLKYYYAVFIKK